MEKTLLKNATIYVGDKKGTTLNNVDLLINEEGNISKIAKNIKDENAKVIDLTGKFVLPGLINMHAHMPAGGSAYNPKKDNSKLVKLITGHKCLNFIGDLLVKSAAKKELYSGVTTVRAVGGIEHYDSKIRDYINEHKEKGSRMYVSDYAITEKGGHMVGTVSKPVETIEEALTLVKDLVDHKVDLIKIMITGGVLDAKAKGEPGEVKMHPEFIKAICDEAHKNNLKVAAHVESYEGAKLALQNGVDTIEHGANFTPDLIELFKKNNSALIETIAPALPIGVLPWEESNMNELIKYNSLVVLKAIIEGAKKNCKTDVLLGVGNDVGCPYITHYSFYRELEFYHNYVGESRIDTLYRATLSNATILGKEKLFGSVEENKYADLIVCSKDPIKEGFAVLGKLDYVIKEGYVIKNPKIKKNKSIENVLDRIMNLDMDKELEGVE